MIGIKALAKCWVEPMRPVAPLTMIPIDWVDHVDAHVHLFLHPGAEDLQTVQESVPERTLIAAGAAKADLMAGFTAERDMGTEGAQAADSAVRECSDRSSQSSEFRSRSASSRSRRNTVSPSWAAARAPG